MLSASLQNRIRKFITPVPRRISANFRHLNDPQQQALKYSLEEHYFRRDLWGQAASPEAYLASKEGQDDLSQHLFGRLDNFRATVIPWLDHVVKGLDGKRVLEIGCGTGTSTIALAEQGAQITAIEIDQPSLAVAEDRAKLYDAKIAFHSLNGAEVLNDFSDQKFDIILYMAVVEHMTIAERLQSLKACWSLLNPGGFLGIIETPNRLWLHDAHTSWLPFYFWLPDDLAYLYAKNSPRSPFNQTFADAELSKMEAFCRQGRGVSFHEIELALESENWKPLLGMRDFLRKRSLLWNLAHWVTTPHGFHRSLKKAVPTVPALFLEQSLDLVIQKV